MRPVVVRCVGLCGAAWLVQMRANADQLHGQAWNLARRSIIPVIEVPAELVGAWQLTRQTGASGSGTVSMPYLVFDAAGRVTGFTGCNRLLAFYQVSGSSLVIRDLGTTRMACKGESGRDERAFLAMLSAVTSWTRDEDSLTLINAAGKTLAVFDRRSNH